MDKKETIEGFYKLSRQEKIALLNLSNESKKLLYDALITEPKIAGIIDELSENTISHYSFPMGVAPNVWINNKLYTLPLVTEESSVVAAIAKAAKFWAAYGGFQATVLGTKKKGQVHFFWKGEKSLLINKFDALKDFILFRIRPYIRRMQKRGGGISNIELVDKTAILDNYYQLDVSFETLDAMGANFINSCLEDMAKSLRQFVSCDLEMDENLLEINMAILSNYTPNCRVKAWASIPIADLNRYGDQLNISNLASKLEHAVAIASIDVGRAVTHNKGIFNGIDAVALATGNDWRALEAGAHAYASRKGSYASLSKVAMNNTSFTIELEIPLAVGTVGGITNLHPLAKIAMEILGKPGAEELMQIMAVSGLAANLSALLALTTSGIQKGHMSMHLSNILRQLDATEEQKEAAKNFFKEKTISYSEVAEFLKSYS
ncbi:MAG: hydroxymethylglutaryl-CoA reductase, degradative [Bacteroidetes bacterium HGW-Bacteroidetes-4]|jgi:hydroxymethylglutaryl-CoA reductase|nr:MAG: hydroxymethylglutaryl-CoA reductase, degradative [Bacteroidetes bacterium HGW-Bacteroidetes-4]